MIIKTAEPFCFPGGKTGCLLVHGFTGAPREMRPMGEHFADKGYSVVGVRLAGHATNPLDLRRICWEDWLHSVEDGYHLLKGWADRIFVCGLSMGGVLTLKFAPQFLTAGLVVMSTPYELPPDPRLKFIRIFKWLKPKVKKGKSDWQNLNAKINHIEYPYYPTHGIAELKFLMAEMRQALPQIGIPTLVIHSRKDLGVAPANAEKIFQHLGTVEKKLIWLENSGHNIVMDQEREKVFRAAENFIGKITLRSV
jgi:carboxylesterase